MLISRIVAFLIPKNSHCYFPFTICATFIKLDLRKPYSFQMFQHYISGIKQETLQKVLCRINQLAIHEGYEDLERMCQDTGHCWNIMDKLLISRKVKQKLIQLTDMSNPVLIIVK
ncbi:MAG: hypothetical protein D4R64_13060 [Porphyromonadaceae bacterium]|nr:MAG: hypothetical protein D4R64_13060 [Porphyromonadaceae bacterium]